MQSRLKSLKIHALQHRTCEEGGMSILNLYFLMATAIFGGIAIDVANLVAAKNQLQVAADVASHSAIVSLKAGEDVDTSKDTALEYARLNMPAGRYGEVLRLENIHFGSYFYSTGSFQIDDTRSEAVWVSTDRLLENANPVGSFLLRLVGFSTFDVRTPAVFVNGDPPCIGAGFFANGRVDMQSNNEFYDAFCISSGYQVEFNQNNYFQQVVGNEMDDDVIVAMPALSNLIVPGGALDLGSLHPGAPEPGASGFQQNEGLWEARRDGAGTFDVDAFIDEIVAGIQKSGTEHTRSFIENSDTWETVNVTSGASNGNGNGGNNGKGGGKGNKSEPSPISPENCTTFSVACLRPDAINRVNCVGDDLTIPAETFSNVVVITDCNLKFANGAILMDATFITESTDDSSISSPQGLQVGDEDGCTVGGGAQLITYGSMKTASKLSLFGGQIIAAGDVNFAAQANGFHGASVIAGGEIDGTSNSQFYGCPPDMSDGNFSKGSRPRLAR